MMTEQFQIADFLALPGVVLDVRSPGEYAQGRIPGAISLPLFEDAERAAVGTTYKKVGKNQAIEQGLRLVGPKLADLSVQARNHVCEGYAKVHCWRGGMRSSSMAWLLGIVGIKTATLLGGYKAFRRWALETLSNPKQVRLIGGLTGSGKTALLHALRDAGEQVLDLEALASHRGSSYGMLGMPPQPSSEQFENEIALQWASFDSKRPVWVEDESRMIGSCKIPDALYTQMSTAPLCLLEISLKERLHTLVQDYGNTNSADLITATQRLKRRLGAVRTKEVVDSITAGKLEQAMEVVLNYYDSTYRYSLGRRKQPQYQIQGDGQSSVELARAIITKMS